MVFDLFTIIMAILSVLSFGAGGAVDGGEEVTSMPILGNLPSLTPAIGEPVNPAPQTETAAVAGSNLIAGSWGGSASVPFVVSVNFKAVVKTDGTARFSGSVSSSMFGNHVFDTPASWVYLGGTSFDTVISGVHTPVTCDGKTLTFPINPYKLKLVDNSIADQNFVIDLHRI